jgi:hypothetical protein
LHDSSGRTLRKAEIDGVAILDVVFVIAELRN